MDALSPSVQLLLLFVSPIIATGGFVIAWRKTRPEIAKIESDGILNLNVASGRVVEAQDIFISNLVKRMDQLEEENRDLRAKVAKLDTAFAALQVLRDRMIAMEEALKQAGVDPEKIHPPMPPFLDETLFAGPGQVGQIWMPDSPGEE